MRHTLPKSYILRGYQTFSRIISNGAIIQGTYLTSYVVSRPSDHPSAMIGFTVSKKRTPLAVQRNRIKRLIKETVRKHFSAIISEAKSKKVSVEIVVSYKGEKQKLPTLKEHDLEPEWMQHQQQILEKL